MDNKTLHSIADNLILLKKDADSPAKEYTWINGDRIIVGIENESKNEIATNEETGLNYERVAVEGYEVYDRPKRVHCSWFLLDLETGSRGWYPGCEIHGDILGEDIKVYTEPNISAEVIETITRATVKILEIDAVDDEPFNPGWYRIKYIKSGYVQSSEISNIRYEDPFVSQ